MCYSAMICVSLRLQISSQFKFADNKTHFYGEKFWSMDIQLSNQCDALKKSWKL